MRLVNKALAAAFTKKAYQPTLLEVSHLTSYADLILIFSGRSLRQVEAIARAIQDALKMDKFDPLGVEGGRGDQWILIDYGSVIIHVFHHPTRTFYDLESLWSDAPRIPLDIPEELRAVNMG